ncbi:MAG: 16S rRNA (guanine(966)-N(2))-methyltransferase RsmD [Epulopiscium sp. Nele67-Bin004]|nr:MAG: 16S rRNA (guanine(966)-N(2))-methyltransferase RsmD [Epulopiscium sp. Nele67-Bin004]
MRVISGKCRGTKLVAPEGQATRPTTDRIKETLFNIINFDIPNSRFLDLFSGSGAIGIEALSRGAKSATFVELDQQACAIISENLQKTRLHNLAKVYTIEVEQIITKLALKGEQFDIIFIDPPYKYNNLEKIVNDIMTHNLLALNGKIIIENSSEAKHIVCDELVIYKTKNYKTTTLSFLERKSE